MNAKGIPKCFVSFSYRRAWKGRGAYAVRPQEIYDTYAALRQPINKRLKGRATENCSRSVTVHVVNGSSTH